MDAILKISAFNEQLDGKLVSVVGGPWCRYFFVMEVQNDKLELVNDVGETVTLEIEDVEKYNIKITVIDLPVLSKHD